MRAEHRAGLSQFGRGTVLRTLILVAAATALLLVVRLPQFIPGTVLGAGLLLGDIYLLKLPMDMLLGRAARRKRLWLLALSLVRLLFVGALLFVVVKFRIGNAFGLFIGVTLPLVALVSLFLSRKVLAWKV